MEYIIRRTSDHLEHHGILGQKWGVRRFQNPDGTWTADGKIRYGSNSDAKNENKMNGPKRSYSDLKKEFANLNYNPYENNPNWAFEDEDLAYMQSVDSFTKFDNLVRDKCGDWYMSEWKSDGLKKIHEERSKAEDELNKENPFDQYLTARHNKYNEVYKQEYDRLMSKPFAKLKEKDYKTIADLKASFAAEMDKKVKELKHISEGQAQLDWYKKRDALRDKYDEKMLGEILNELGYKNTKDARDYIRTAVMWD